MQFTLSTVVMVVAACGLTQFEPKSPPSFESGKLKAIPTQPLGDGASREVRPLAPQSQLKGESPRAPFSPPKLDVTPIPPVPTVDRTRRTLPIPSPLLFPTHMREPTEREIAAAALGRIGRAAVPSLMQALRHRDPEVRTQAALVLARIGPDAFEAVPDLTPLLDDDQEAVRKAAARALGQIGPAASDAVPALMRTLVQPKPVTPDR